MATWCKVIAESEPLALGPAQGGEGVHALGRVGGRLASDGVNWLARESDGGALGPLCRWPERLKRVIR